jgi:hypothetical protein
MFISSHRITKLSGQFAAQTDILYFTECHIDSRAKRIRYICAPCSVATFIALPQHEHSHELLKFAFLPHHQSVSLSSILEDSTVVFAYKISQVVPRRIFERKRDEVTGEWRKLHNVELHDLYCPPNIVRVIKSRRIRWAEHVTRRGRGEACTGFWWGNLRERDFLEDPSIDGRIILRWIFMKWDVGVWTGLSWLR